jgi:flagellar biogenesis protein FliO
MPDYGGRNSPMIPLADGADAPNPLAQAGRTLVALAVVLGGIYGVVLLLKRAGYRGTGPIGPALLSGLRSSMAPAAPAPQQALPADAAHAPSLVLVQSQPLPGGGAVHLVSVNDNTLFLVGSTGQSVSRLAEWDWEEETPPQPGPATENPAFSDYLDRAASPAPPQRPPGEWTPAGRLSDLLAGARQKSRDEVNL